jgi:hypothetical protein
MSPRIFLILLPLACASCAGGHSIAAAPPPITPEPPVATPDSLFNLGYSVEGRPIDLHVFGGDPDGDGEAVLILAAIHGNEATSATVAQRLIEHLRDHPDTCTGRTVAVIPVANPDGLFRRLRTNRNLVDLNRNFPAANWAKTRKGQYFGGDRPASEPETLAVLAAIDRVRPDRIVSIHSMDKPCNNYDGPARNLAEQMHRGNGYPVKDNIGYPTPGSLGSWAGVDRSIPIITLELARSARGEQAWEQNRDALLSAIEGDRSAGSADVR